MMKNRAESNIVADVKLKSGNAEFFIFGNSKNWKDDFKNHPELISILKERKIKDVYIPHTSTFCGTLSNSNNFSLKSTVNGIRVMNGLYTEGLVVPKGSAVVLYSADCPTIIYHDLKNGLLIVAHAGLGSLIDKQKIIIDVASRPNESVIDELMSLAKEKETNNYEIFVLCGIGESSFKYDINDPVYGDTNKKIFAYLNNHYGTQAVPFGSKKGNISLLGIIEGQLDSYGINTIKIQNDGIDTYSDPRFWSHFRNVQIGQKGLERNAILIVNN
jgi:copper oxidase (laccase) domain-containing protein